MSETTTTRHRAKPSLFDREFRSLSIGAVSLCSMIAFEAIGVAAGMPAVASALDGMSLYALAFAGTLAGSVVAMVWAGGDCDRHGPFRSMALGMLLFAIGLLMAGLAHSMLLLVAGRIVQGLGVGALGVAMYVAAARALPAELHPRLFALFSSAWVVPAIVGPAISGWIVEQLGWRWLFLAVLLLLLPTAALILPPLRGKSEPISTTRQSWRMLPWALLASLSSVALALSADAGMWMLLIVLAAVLAIVISATRLLPPGTLRMNRGLPTVIALRGLNSSAFFLSEAFVPLWLHQQRGWSITAAGLALTGGALSWSLGSHLQSRMIRETTRHGWLARGCLLLVLGIGACMASVLGLLPEWCMLIGWSITGLGMGVSFPMLGVLTLKLAPREQQGIYSSALQLSSALATSAALAAGGLAFALLQEYMPTQAFVSVYALAGLFAAIAWVNAKRTLPAD
ncbi:MAG TPA: MFS transporter [Dokdonella sp.]|uniref:MFS transporter n=1 Tax=Dokdonella sp. TaxID=2291710 RepID=UPI002D803F23|nr:MFS transporter [Dokdonella sp.]HET9033504.1 MFS transporter [Dokdonella sp.]